MLEALVGKKMDNMHKQVRNFSRKLKNTALKSSVNERNEKKVTEMKYTFHGLMSIFEAAETGSWKKQESSRKTSISALLTMPKPLTV